MNSTWFKQAQIYYKLSRPQTFMLASIAVITFCYIGFKITPSPATHNTLVLMGNMILGILSGIFFSAGNNALNQVYDLEIDRIVKSNRPLPQGLVSEKGANLFSLGCFAAALILYAIATQGRLIPILFTVIGIFCTIAYSAPPLRLKRFMITSNILMDIPKSYGLILAGWAIASKTFDVADPWVYGSIIFLYFLAGTSIKDFSDIEGDKKYGIETLPIKYGVINAAKIIAFFIVTSYVLFVGLIILQMYFGIIFFHANMTALLLLAITLLLINIYIALKLIQKPFEERTTENHPIYKYIYIQYILFYLGLIICYSV